MAPRHITQTDAIRELVQRINEEKRKIEDALEMIRDYLLDIPGTVWWLQAGVH